MNTTRIQTLAIAATLVACASPGEPSAVEIDEPAAQAAAAPASPGVALRIEQAERDLDVGRDVAGARASLEAALADPAITPEQRDQARLALSRALEAEGDHEGATRAVEALLAEHGDGQRWPMEEAAEARLRKLVTGSDAEPRRSRPEDARQASAFARALAKYFPYFPVEKDQRSLDVRIFAFGGNVEASERFLTFDVARAVREQRREACPLCDENLRIMTSSSRSGSWVGIPKSRAKLGSALAIYYFDLGDGRIPARYDAELPMPSAEVVARLERGEGLVAARERPGAPPAILIAAPREAQLADVEDVLSQMKALPTEPVAVPLKPNLRPQEIQAVVRASFGSFRACYEGLLKRSPEATGKIPLHFSIGADGRVEGVSTEGTSPTLHDATFEGCMIAATSALRFSATRESTKVTYPIVFTPGE
jgi:hypothetical protein